MGKGVMLLPENNFVLEQLDTASQLQQGFAQPSGGQIILSGDPYWGQLPLDRQAAGP